MCSANAVLAGAAPRCARLGRLRAPAADDQGRAARGPGGPSAVRDQPDLSARALRTPAPDLRIERRPAAAVARHRGVLGVVASDLGRRTCIAPPESHAGDRVFFAFSFGPFIGFWSAFGGAQRLGALSISGGAMTSEQRLRNMLDLGATVLLSTPTYALRLADVASELGLDLRASGVRVTIHAGEPGASIPATRAAIEEAYRRHVLRPHGHDGAGSDRLQLLAAGRHPPDRVGVHLRGARRRREDPPTRASSWPPTSAGGVCR